MTEPTPNDDGGNVIPGDDVNNDINPSPSPDDNPSPPSGPVGALALID